MTTEQLLKHSARIFVEWGTLGPDLNAIVTDETRFDPALREAAEQMIRLIRDKLIQSGVPAADDDVAHFILSSGA